MKRWQFGLTTLGLYAGWHAILFSLGLRFDIGPLGMFAHYADPELLRHRLWESLFYLHVQPPLYNLFIGIILKAFPGHELTVFHTIFLLSGLALYLLMIALQRQLGVSRTIATIISTIFLYSPSYLLFEHLLVYTLHVALLLTLAAVLLLHYLSQKQTWTAWAFFVTLCILCGIRSLYHIAYYAVVATAILVLAWDQRKRLVWIAVIPGLVLFSFYAKNYVLFGHFSVFSFFGKSPWIKTVGNIPWSERLLLVKEGKLSKASLVERFWSIDHYPPEYRNVQGFDNIPVLREETKSTGEVNYNHLSQIAISDAYLHDAIYATLHYPKTFLCSTAWATLTFLSPMRTDDPPLSWLAKYYNPIIYGHIPIKLATWFPKLGASRHEPYIGLMLAVPLAFLYGCWKILRSRKTNMPHETRAVLTFMCFTILYVTSTSIIFELAETNRYRFETDPFTFTLLAILAQDILTRFHRRA